MKTTAANKAKFIIKDEALWHRDASGKSECIAPYIRATLSVISPKGWQTVLDFRDNNGKLSTIKVDPSDVKKLSTIRDLLLNRGFKWPPIKSERESLLHKYISREPTHRVTLVEKTGWYEGKTFVFPDTVIGTQAETVKYRTLGTKKPISFTKGDLVTWQRTINKILCHSSTAMLAVGTAFGGPFHQALRIESGGFNLYGPPGRGKTSAALAALSVYSPSGRDHVTTWDITETRLDELRCECSDMLVYLDDMGRAGNNHGRRIARVSDAAFRLTTGTARQRSRFYEVDTEDPPSWLSVLSSSVQSMLDISLAAGSHVFGGEEVRLIDVPAVVSEKLGIFEACPPAYESTRDAIVALERVCAANFGVAGREYIKRIVRNKSEAIEFVRERVALFVSKAGVTGTVEERYVQRFGLAYAGLKLAAHYGIIKLPKNAGLTAVLRCYRRAREAAPSYPEILAKGYQQLRDSLLNRSGIIDLSASGRTTTKSKFEKCSGVLIGHAAHGLIYAVKLDALQKLSDSISAVTASAFS